MAKRKVKGQVAEVTAVYLPAARQVTVTMSLDFLSQFQGVLDTIVNGNRGDIDAMFTKEERSAAQSVYDIVGDCSCPDCLPAINEGI
jgi:hypothetical protein